MMLYDVDPVTCVFATTTRDHPIHLWDATSGLVPFILLSYLLFSLNNSNGFIIVGCNQT